MRRRDGYGQALLLMFAVGVVFLLGVAGLFTHWRQQRLSFLESGSGLTLLPQGIMEYADRGEGPAVLVIHGSPGGYDQGLVYGEELKLRGFRIIAISRPGYLRTPLMTGVTMEEQADAIDSLLSSLGISSCAVLGVAEGAPSALQLAQRHPERVTSMALLCPQTTSLGYSPIASLGYQLFHDLTGDLGCWYLMLWLKANPISLYEQEVAFGSTMKPSRAQSLTRDALADPRQASFLSSLLKSITPLSPREAGIINDNAQLKDLPIISQMKISTPLLMLIGEDEKRTPQDGIRQFVSSLPGAALIIMPSNGPVAPIGRKFGLVWDQIADFLKDPLHSHLSPPTSL